MARRHLLHFLAARHELAVGRHQQRGVDATAAIDDELRLHPVQLSASCSRAGSIVTGLPLAKTRSVRFAPIAKVTLHPTRPPVSIEIWPIRLTWGFPMIALEAPV